MKSIKNDIEIDSYVLCIIGSSISKGKVQKINKVTYRVEFIIRPGLTKCILVNKSKVCHHDDVCSLVRDSEKTAHHYDYNDLHFVWDRFYNKAFQISTVIGQRLYQLHDEKIVTINDGKIKVIRKKVNGSAEHVTVFQGLNPILTYSINLYFRKVKVSFNYYRKNPIRQRGITRMFKPDLFVFNSSDLSLELEKIMNVYATLVVDSYLTL